MTEIFINNLKKVKQEIIENGEINRILNGERNPTYVFITKNKEKIKKLAKNKNELAVFIVKNEFYFKTDRQKLISKLKKVEQEIIEKGEINRISNGERNPTYTIVNNYKNEIIKLANKGQKTACFIVENVSVFKSKDKNIINRIKEIKIEIIKNGKLYRNVNNKVNTSYSYVERYKEEIIELAKQGNEDAIYIVNNANYFKSSEQILLDRLSCIRNKIDSGEKIVSKTNGKTNADYSFIQIYKDKIISLASENNEDAVIIVDNIELFKTKEEKFNRRLKEIVDYMKENNNFIDTYKQTNHLYNYIKQNKNEINLLATKNNEDALYIVNNLDYYKEVSSIFINNLVNLKLDLDTNGKITYSSNSSQTKTGIFYVNNVRKIINIAILGIAKKEEEREEYENIAIELMEYKEFFDTPYFKMKSEVFYDIKNNNKVYLKK